MNTFYINPGELRTQINIQYPVESGTGINKTVNWTDIVVPTDDNPSSYIMSRWESLKGSETELSDSTQIVGYFTVTVRYCPLINDQCRIVNNNVTYQITNIIDPTQRKQWLQITVKSAVMSGG